MSDPIKRLPPNAKGQIRYRFVVDIGREVDPETGRSRRRQLTVTKDTLKEARAAYAAVSHQRDTGTLISPNRLTVGEWVDQWYAKKVADVEEATAYNYAMLLRNVHERLGAVRLQELTEEDVEAFRDYLLTAARKRGGVAGTGLHPKTVTEVLNRLREILQRAVIKKLVHANVATYVVVTRKARAQGRKEYQRAKPWGPEEVQTFIAGLNGERLHAPLLLSLMGLRPAEVCGLRWGSEVDLKAGTIDISNTRTMIANSTARVVEKETKTEAGTRVLPLPAKAADALRDLRRMQAREKLAAGEAYAASGYVFVDELGAALTTKDLREQAYKIMKQLGMRRVRLYDARHSCLTYLSASGVADHVLAAWAGHTNADFTRRKYVHPSAEDLRPAADAWDGLHGAK